MLKTAPLVFLFLASLVNSSDFLVGRGRADITGPAADVTLMGYANENQTAGGIHIRVSARAFVIAEQADPSKRIVYVNLDLGMTSQSVKTYVVEKLQTIFGKDMYTIQNVCISSTHTHSTPGGFLQYLLYNLPSLGFVKESFDAVVDGTVRAIQKAHADLKPVDILLNSGKVYGANINRSPTSYLANPATERALYDDGDTDKTMLLLKFVDSTTKKDLGMLNFFATHGTSMNNTNHLISGDNKGYAEQVIEKAMNPLDLAGKGDFIAAFSSSNLGDVSPNTVGAFCTDSGKPCDMLTSTCDGKNELCRGIGPGKDMFEATEIIGGKQAEAAMALYKNATSQLSGKLSFVHMNVDMSNQEVPGEGYGRTCQAAMGYAFAAGTTDGCGAFDFYQGENSTNPFWNMVSGLLSKPTQEQIDCQAPKPILLNTGAISLPFAWAPAIVETQLFKIGSLVIVAVPGEFTTMSGRRLRKRIADTFAASKEKVTVVIAGLSNTYSSYIVTPEEFVKQRYEAASTLFGPLTLHAYMNVYQNLSSSIISGQVLPDGPQAPDLIPKQISLLPGVIEDSTPSGKHFGDVTEQPLASYSLKAADVVVSATFVSGCPRNDLRTENSFLTVDKFNNTSLQWDTKLVDSDWETRYIWTRPNTLSGVNYSTIQWRPSKDTEAGLYRITHSGTSKSLFGKLTPYHGASNSFSITA